MRSSLITTLAILAAVSLSCLATGCAEDENGPACEAYVEKLNALECLPDDAELDDDWCTANAFDNYPCDIASYFQCQEASVSCDGDTFVDDRSSCGIPVCN